MKKIYIIIAAYTMLVTSCAKPEVECSMNGFGSGTCVFSNTTNFIAEKTCVNVRVVESQALIREKTLHESFGWPIFWASQYYSGSICSGIIFPGGQMNRIFSIDIGEACSRLSYPHEECRYDYTINERFCHNEYIKDFPCSLEIIPQN